WAISYRAVCEASGGAWSPALHDRGMQCLGRTRNAIAAVADVLATADERAASHADAAVAELPRPEACSDPAYVARAAPPPTDPARARAADAIDRSIARARAIDDTGRPTIALALLPPLTVAAASI